MQFETYTPTYDERLALHTAIQTLARVTGFSYEVAAHHIDLALIEAQRTPPAAAVA
jgi:hypothetical protein